MKLTAIFILIVALCIEAQTVVAGIVQLTIILTSGAIALGKEEQY
jgi:membrane protein YqaA with SNARE-associated domain